MIVKCKNCNKETNRKQSQVRRNNFCFCSYKCYWKNLKSLREKETGNWKGSKAGYRALHLRLENSIGKASNFSCKQIDETCKGRLEWSNISRKYKQVLSDWQILCQSHHKRYDLRK